MRSEASGPNDPPAKIPSTGRLSKRAPPGSNPTSWHAKAKPILPNWPVLPTILDDGTCIHFGRPACTKLPLRHQRACNRGPYQARSSGSRIHFEEDRISASGRPAALIRILTIKPLLHNGEQMRGPRKVYLDGVPPRGVTDGIGRRAVRLGRVGQRAATAGRLMKGSSLNCPTLSSVM